MKISQLIEVIPGIIIFKISEMEFCINVNDVHLIKRIEESDQFEVYDSNDISYIKIYNINIPIVDISNFFQPNNNYVNKRKIVLIIKHHSENDKQEKTFGILVDEVVEIISADKSENNYLLQFNPSNENPFVSGAIFWGERKILLPNYSKIASTIFLKEIKVQ